MHIKSVTIQGFKSYNDKTVVEPFHRGHNVVVGRNGSGKSNFFAAIEFVLSDEFSNLRVEQRSSLLHEGSGPRPVSAFVEIIFDNTDRRFPVDTDEVAIKRCIGAKKDQFYLNSKLASNKSEVVGWLETAGFSYSNPYYIVKQGQINSIACCSDRERLRVVRSVAGTEVYTDKRKNAEEDLAASDTVINQVTESLRMVADRLDQLGEEKELLEKFKSEDKKRRVLEFAILEADMKEERGKLSSVETELGEYAEDNDNNKKIFEKKSLELGEEKSKLHKLKGQLKILSIELKEVETTHEKLSRQKEALELQVADGDSEASQFKVKKSKFEVLKSEIANVSQLLKEKNEEMAEVLGKSKTESECLALLEQGRNQIFARKGRREQFDTKEERDAWIIREMKSIEEKLEVKRIQVMEMSRDLKGAQERLEEDEVSKERRKEEHDQISEKLKNDLFHTREAVTKKSETDRKLADTIQTCNRLRQSKDDVAKEEQTFSHKLKTIPGMKQILVGNQSILTVLKTSETLNDGYYGLVVNLFQCPDQLFTAVDETAGTKLFFHVVEDDQVATALMAKLNEMKLPGIFNLLPLNRIRSKTYDYSMLDGKDAFPILDKLQYEMDFSNIMNFVFGKTVVCRNMDTVVKLAKSSNLDCITLDGEKGSSRGVLSGGYISLEKSKMANYDKYQAIVGKLGDITAELEFSEDEVTKLKEQAKSLSQSIQKLESSRALNEGSLSSLVLDVKLLERSCEELKKKCVEDEQSLADMETDGKLLEASLESFRKEMGEDMNSQLSLDEKGKLELMIRNIEKSKGNLKKHLKVKDRISGEKNQVETKLLDLKKDERDSLADLEDKRRKDGLLEKDKLELEQVTLQLKIEKQKLDHDMAMEHNLHEQVKNSQKWIEKKEKEVEKMRQAMDGVSGRKGMLIEKKNHHLSTLKKLEVKLNGLGGVQPEMLAQLRNMSRTQMGKTLQKTNKNLKKYDKVNKKALDQFVTFTEENERLVARLNQLAEDKARILDMINVLDNKKSEQILYTYKQLYKNFKQMFSRVVGGGKGELVLTGGDMEGLTEAEKMESATGLSVSVSFTGGQVMKNLDQLSGGQKSVVALTFILAIQQCDPAPFYLFDEVDAALDVEHRRAVAAVIHSQASEAQFITTTFRPEMLRNADQCWGVVFRGKASHVEPVTNKDAASFVEDGKIQQ